MLSSLHRSQLLLMNYECPSKMRRRKKGDVQKAKTNFSDDGDMYSGAPGLQVFNAASTEDSGALPPFGDQSRARLLGPGAREQAMRVPLLTPHTPLSPPISEAPSFSLLVNNQSWSPGSVEGSEGGNLNSSFSSGGKKRRAKKGAPTSGGD